MAQLEKDLWIAGGYYIDFDDLEQFRIIGPQNHLFCGLIDIPRHSLKINNVKAVNSLALIKGSFISKHLNFYYPVIDDIRTMREVIRPTATDHPITFLEVRSKLASAMVPNLVKLHRTAKETHITFKRVYEDNWYGTTFTFPNSVLIEKINRPYKGFKLTAVSRVIPFQIKAETNDYNKWTFKKMFLPAEMNFHRFGKDQAQVKYFWQRTKQEIAHLISWHKTSGDRFGTVFPRDWMETADLGVHDLTAEVREYMYAASLKNVSAKGEGWHEDVVGEYRYEHELSGEDLFDRKMIDIEPHYLLGLKRIDKTFLQQTEVKEALKRVAKYLLKQAREQDLILFKKVDTKLAIGTDKRYQTEKYFPVGNWRDHDWAYKKISETIAPFDVNAVFYPEALKVLKDYQTELGMHIRDIDALIKKWEGVRKLYKFTTISAEHGELPAYALALYNIQTKRGRLQFERLKVNHLDEAYLYTYSQVDEKQIISFCKRLLDPNYFYTPSGPLLIARNNNIGYTTQEYHGLVIWAKQAAFAVLGLSKHYKLAKEAGWSKNTITLIRTTILTVCKDTIHAFCVLKAIPELHFDNHGAPQFFTHQEGVRMYVSKVQLWSAIGARRIIRKYYELLNDKY